jgi:hypothetical protein
VTPLATSAIKTIYVIGWSRVDYNPNSDPVNGGECPIGQVTCTATFAITIYAPPSAFQAEISTQKYLYWNVTAAGTSLSDGTTLQLAANATFSAPQRVGNDAYEIIASISNSKIIVGASASLCIKETVARDGIGLPGPSVCGSESIPAAAGSVWGGAP